MFDLSIIDTIQIGLTLGLAYGLQSLIGFGGGLLALPVLLGLGYSLPQSIQISAIGSLFQSLYCSYSLRSHIDWQAVRVPMVSRLVCLCLGVYVLTFVADFDQALLKQWVGVAILVFTLFTYFIKPIQKDRVPLQYGVLAGSLSGFISGLVGMGGPPLVFWVLSHKWGANAMKVGMFAVFGPSSLFQIILNILVFKSEVLPVAISAVLSIPIQILGILIGLKLSKKIDQNQLRKMMLCVLILIGMKAILRW